MTTQERTAADLICPKCGGTMRQYERGGVTVDQCTDCRGIFLDRGELERLMDAESGYYEARGGPQSRSYDRDDDHDDDRGGHDRGGYGERRRRKKGGFLGDLFDFG